MVPREVLSPLLARQSGGAFFISWGKTVFARTHFVQREKEFYVRYNDDGDRIYALKQHAVKWSHEKYNQFSFAAA